LLNRGGRQWRFDCTFKPVLRGHLWDFEERRQLNRGGCWGTFDWKDNFREVTLSIITMSIYHLILTQILN